MQVVSAREAKHQFGPLVDTARAQPDTTRAQPDTTRAQPNTTRAQPVSIEKHGPPVVAVVAIEEHEGLSALRPLTTVSTASGSYSNE